MHLILLQIDSAATSPNFFKDYSDYIVGIPTFIISSLLAYWLYKKQASRKEVTYAIRSVLKIIDIQSAFKNKFQVLYNGHTVNDLSLIVIEFINSGNQPITKEDFESDIEIELRQSINKNIYVLSADITEKNPKNISTVLKGSGTQYFISPCLLNPKDSFKIQLLIDFEDVADITVDVKARISGIRELKRLQRKEDSPEDRADRAMTYKFLLNILVILFSLISLTSGSKVLSSIINALKKAFE